MATEVTGPWEELVSRPEFRGHTVRITVVDQPRSGTESGDWLENLRRLADGGIRTTRPADDSREGIYEEAE